MERKLYVDETENRLTFVNVQDVEPILEFNKLQRSEDQHSDWGRRVARVPNTIMLQWFYEEHAKGNVTLQMYSDEFDRIIARKLDDPDWAYLRTDKKPSIITGVMGFGS
jgi:hypothetical protein